MIKSYRKHGLAHCLARAISRLLGVTPLERRKGHLNEYPRCYFLQQIMDFRHSGELG